MNSTTQRPSSLLPAMMLLVHKPTLAILWKEYINQWFYYWRCFIYFVCFYYKSHTGVSGSFLVPYWATIVWKAAPLLCDLRHLSLKSLSVHLGTPQIEIVITMTLKLSVPSRLYSAISKCFLTPSWELPT